MWQNATSSEHAGSAADNVQLSVGPAVAQTWDRVAAVITTEGSNTVSQAQKPFLLMLAEEAVRDVNTRIASSSGKFPRVCRRLRLLQLLSAHRSFLQGQKRETNMAYTGEIRYNMFRLTISACPLRHTPTVNATPETDVNIITLEVLAALPAATSTSSLAQIHPDVIVFRAGLVHFDSINRLSRRAVHEQCMKTRDPAIPAAYCVCDAS